MKNLIFKWAGDGSALINNAFKFFEKVEKDLEAGIELCGKTYTDLNKVIVDAQVKQDNQLRNISKAKKLLESVRNLKGE